MTLIHQFNGRIITNWYTKTTTSDRLLNYLSFHPYSMKFNIAKSFVNKVFTLSDPIFNRMNTQRIQQILLKNNYPQKMIDRIFKDRRFKQKSQKPPTPPAEKPKYAGMQYIPKLSENILRTLHMCTLTLNIAPKPTMKLKNTFSNMKAKIDKENIRNVVYGLQCKDPTCRKNRYVGQTFRRVGIRTGEHSKDYENRQKPGGKTAVIRHALEMEKEHKKEHEIDFSIDKVLILDREPDKF